MEPRYPIPTCEHLTKRYMFPGCMLKGKRQSLHGQHGESCPNVRRVDLTNNCHHHGHFINKEWELVTCVLLTRDMTERHTGHNLEEHLRNALTEWGITEKDPVIVTDNASNMTTAAEEAAFTLHVKCYAPILNLAAQCALKIPAVARLLGRVRRIVNFFRRSTTANHMLKEKEASMTIRAQADDGCGYQVCVWLLFNNLLSLLLIHFVKYKAVFCASIL